jgi:hypothetical protein
MLVDCCSVWFIVKLYYCESLNTLNIASYLKEEAVSSSKETINNNTGESEKMGTLAWTEVKSHVSKDTNILFSVFFYDSS